jgi:ATP-binding cassette subfamily F protein 3
MSLVSGIQLAKSYGPNDLFAGVNVAIPHGARIALVGPNGAGKTTLLRLLAGLEEPSLGTVSRAKGVRVGYLPQEAAYSVLRIPFDSDNGIRDTQYEITHTLWDEMLTAFADLRAREAELAGLEAAMADPARRDAVMEKYGALQRQFELDGGYEYENRIRFVLHGLNFEPGDYHKPVEILSGGQKTRALLGRLLLESPDLLILDEPTNHLDIHAVEWLEEWLDEWGGAVVIVSHDRYFMDQTVSAVWELQFGALTEYRGNYSAYVTQRAERRARQSAEYEAQQAFVAKERDYIRRNLSGQNTKQAKGRLRRLERMMREPTAQHPDDARVFKPLEAHTLRLSMDTDLRSGDRVIETHDLAVGYADDGKVLFRAPDVLLWREECAALVGPNGAGKTTFLKTLLGEVSPLAGRVKLGSSLKVGYFAQAHEGLDPERTVIEEITSVRYMPPGQARDYLAKFLFTGDDVFKRVEVLSGGERGRVALAKLALQGANLLLLDEPTNHLDILSQEILEAVLADFPGTILLVSHDRYLIDALATQIWSLEEGRLEVFKGSWSEYVGWREAKEEGRRVKDEEQTSKPQIPSSKFQVASGKSKMEGRKSEIKSLKSDVASQPSTIRNQKSQERKRAARLSELENTIAALEARRVEITRDLESAGADVARVRALGEEYAQVEAELSTRLEEWESLAA